MLSREQAQSFDRLAESYDRHGELEQERWENWTGGWVRSVLPESGARALDAGCGTGRHAVILAERFGHVDGVDLSGPMIELAEARRPLPNLRYRRCDLRDLTVADEDRYDFILSILTLHHVPDLHAALSNLKSLLAPGGRLAVMDLYVVGMQWPHWTLRGRLHALFVLRLARDLLRRGRATAWEIYRLSTGPGLDHRVSDRYFRLDELEQSCRALFPGCTIEPLSSDHDFAVVWDALADRAAGLPGQADREY
jgi:ubiquinone/menaquinone biosynthesis C-methylase UbiE